MHEDNGAQTAQVHTPRGSDLSLLYHDDPRQVHGLEASRGTETGGGGRGDTAGGTHSPWKGPRLGPKVTCPLEAAG